MYKTGKTLLTLLTGALLWEWGSSLWENYRAGERYDYWHTYYDPDTIQEANQRRQVYTLRSTGVNLHIDVYPAQIDDAPLLIFNHGSAGYGRLFVTLALAYNEAGYTVILPDQRSQGLSGGRRGDYTITECVQNLVDVAWWAKNHFQRPLFMAGGSVGGALTYYAASAGAPVEAITCLNLFDFGNGKDGLQISRLSMLAQNDLFTNLIQLQMRLLKPLYWLRIPFNWMGAFDKLMDERDADFQRQWDADPIPPRLVSLRSLASNLTTPPTIPIAENQVPTLVINKQHEQMVDVNVTHHNYERLGGEKQYLEIPFGHWSSRPLFWQTIVKSSDEWFKLHHPPCKQI